MRYELTDKEWTAINPMLPNKPRGVPRMNDRRVLNGIFWVLRSGAPWRDLPNNFGPYTTCYNRFARRRRAGLGQDYERTRRGHDVAVQMIDTSIVRVHQRELPFEVRRDQLDSLGRRRRRDHLQRGDRGRRRCRVRSRVQAGVEGIVSKRLAACTRRAGAGTG